MSRQNKKNTLKKNVSVKTQVHCCVHSDGHKKNNQTAQTEEALDRSTVWTGTINFLQTPQKHRHMMSVFDRTFKGVFLT